MGNLYNILNLFQKLSVIQIAPFILHELPMIAITNYHQLGGLNNKHLFSQLRGPKLDISLRGLKSKYVGSITVPLKGSKQNLSPCLFQFLMLLALLGLCQLLHSHIAFFESVSNLSLLLLIGVYVTTFGNHPDNPG